MGASLSIPSVSKGSKLHCWPSVVLSYFFFFFFVEIEIITVPVHTIMHAVAVCFRNPLNYDTDYRIFNLLT